MKLALTLLTGSLVVAGCAAGPKEEDHAAHHPAGAADAAVSATPTPGQMDSTMKSMREMHDRMMAAKTPEERARLREEHMKAMQDGMAMMSRMREGKGGTGMGGMRGSESPMGPQMMAKRMEMMEMMMQMMMDREAMKPPAPR